MRTNTLRYLTAVAAVTLTGLCTGVQAEGLYRTVDSNGRVILTDRPPANSTNVTEISSSTGRTARANNEPQVNLNLLPPAVRTAWNAFPVTLFTTDDCAGCASGKEYLQTRGIPFIEYTVNTNQDIEEYKSSVSPSTGFPSLRVGSKVITGFNMGEWKSYLDAASYPLENQLPNSYRNPAPQPLTDPSTHVQEVPQRPIIITPGVAPERRNPDDRRTPDNPAGIRF